MKILVVSLLRMGDLVMASGAIAGLREKYPKAEIDLLTNDSNSGVLPLLNINKSYIFQRASLQKDLGEEDRPIFAGIDHLKTLVDEINSKEYDLVINLTQNRLSGYLCALIEAKEKTGLVISENDQAFFGSPWFRHLNDFAHVNVPHLFHFVDIFKAAMGLTTKVKSSGLTATTAGQKEIAGCLPEAGTPILVIQPFTSDEKKNWLVSHWAEFIATFSKLHPEFAIHVFGAPSEKAGVNKIVEVAEKLGAKATTTILSLEGAFAFLQKAELCVSVDTGIKHLAVAAKTKKIVELVFGSSDYKRTGAYTDQVLILRSKESCQPCGHSSACSREERFCASRVSPLSVASLTAQYYRKDIPSLVALADEYADEVDCFLGRMSASGFWWPEKIGAHTDEINSAYLLELFAWKMILHKEHLERVAPYGVHVRHFRASFGATEEVSSFVLERLMREYSEKSSHIVRLQSDIVRLAKGNLSQATTNGAIEKEIIELEKRLTWDGFLLPRWRELAGQGLGRVRQVQRLLSDVEQLQQVRLKMLQSLRDLPRESL
jgi:heptosyltransferase-2